MSRSGATSIAAVLVALAMFIAACGTSTDSLQPGQRALPTAVEQQTSEDSTADDGAPEPDTSQSGEDTAGRGERAEPDTPVDSSDADTEAGAETSEPDEPVDEAPAADEPEPEPTSPPTGAIADASYFATLPPRTPLPSDQACADAVRLTPLPETHPENAQANQVAGGPAVRIDGADEDDNDVLAPRITGNFTGTTEELIRWVACKWGFDEDLTRARAWTESSWSIETEGDQTDYAPACDYLELSIPCFQSYGLLQVKGSVHEGTYPFAHGSTAWGLDYAMAWQRACYEGAFSWLIDDGYTAGDVNGCVGAWFSGEWFDDLAVGYLADVAWNLDNRPWD